MVISAKQFLWNFNWNSTDTELDNNIKTAFNALGSTLGTTLGNTLGYIVCGALPTTAIATFNEPLALHILQELNEEGAEEIASNMAILIQQTGRLLSQVAFTWFYKNSRNLFNEMTQAARNKLGIANAGIAEAAAKANKEPWSFASAVEEKVESIDNKFLQNLIEEGIEEFDDACIEAGYIVAQGIDSYLAAAKAAHEGTWGPDETVRILLNRS